MAVAGGDGSVADVFRRLAGSSVPATILPLGTANNIASSLGIAAGPRVLVAGWPGGKVRSRDLGTVACSGREACFVESVGGGLIADAIACGQHLDEDGSLDDGLRLLAQLLGQATAKPWQLELDGVPLTRELVGIEAMLIRRAGPGIPLAPPTDPRDATLDVVLIGEPEARALALYVEQRLEHPSPPPLQPRLPVLRARTVRIAPPPGTKMRVDDEPWEVGSPLVASTGRLSVRILLPSAVVPRDPLRRRARPRRARRLRARASVL